MKKTALLFLLPLFILFSCKQQAKSDHPALTKKVDVFGIPIYATETAPDNKLLHAAHVLAEFLDNNEDGSPDNPLVVDALLTAKAILVMTPNSGPEWELILPDLHYAFPDAVYHDNFANEARPNALADGKFDGLWEETLHLITRHGWGNAYPEVFGPSPGTKIGDAVDGARGGQFLHVPEAYPEKAWYTYYDESCGYGCQIDEYVYWALTSLLGVQDRSGLDNEWKLNTEEKLKEGDPAIYSLLTNPEYKFPTIIPHGDYTGYELIIEECFIEIKVQKENEFPPDGKYPAEVAFITECQAPGGEAMKISFIISEDRKYGGRKLALMADTRYEPGSQLAKVLEEIKPELSSLESLTYSDIKSIEGSKVWLTTEPMTGSTGAIFPKIVKIEPIEN